MRLSELTKTLNDLYSTLPDWINYTSRYNNNDNGNNNSNRDPITGKRLDDEEDWK